MHESNEFDRNEIELIEFTELSPEYNNDVGLMLSSCKDVESAEIPVLLERIAQCVQKTGKRNEFCSIDAENGVAWLLNHCQKAHELFQDFLKKHGHRAFAEVSYKCQNQHQKNLNETKPVR